MRQHSLTLVGTDRVLCSTTVVAESQEGMLRRFFLWDVEAESATDLTALFRPDYSEELLEGIKAALEEDEDEEPWEEGDELDVLVERSFAVSADGRRLVIQLVLRAAGDHVEHQLRTVDLDRGTVIATSREAVAPGLACPAPNNDVSAVGMFYGYEGYVSGSMWNGRRDYPVLMGVSADGALAYFAGKKRLLAVQTADLRTVARELRLKVTPYWGTVCGDTLVAVTFDPETIAVIDLQTGRTRHSFPLKKFDAVGIHAARTAPIVAIETTQRQSVLIDVETGELRRLKPLPKIHKESHADLALSPDGKTLVAVDRDRPVTAVVVDVETTKSRSIDVKIPTDPLGWACFTVVGDRFLVPDGLGLRSTSIR